MDNKRKAITLVEITLAVTILVIAIIPLFTMSSNDAAKAIETEKIQMAERILESVKSELMTMQFKTFYERAEAECLDKESAGPFVLSDGYYPVSYSDVLKIQSQYKDFKVIGTWSWVMDGEKVDKTMVQADIECSFSKPGPNVPPVVRKKSFLIVKP